ncbi:Tyrosine recombinase XerC [Pseudovibrio axinellae]|uniref:Tyrosine recombinase XerC n=1 Tax=Pseudovibrio axinellae TaxID=989403 RepID=A0A161X7F8_9HYPH|nr:tyrosine-type recombinase/integrase [Pseudovibrio axinellae]KZL04574.1 Tyrosine recombinase XerC [Pseudovibrio axinellae]SEQ72572.1 Site-specific recombinase XerD [Pseudovibrio axinellae]
MGFSLSRGIYYFVKRVPKRYALVEPRTRIQISLKTKSPDVAEKKSLMVEERLVAYWEALLANKEESAQAHYKAALNFASAHGFSYLSIDDVVVSPLDDLVKRVNVIPETEVPRQNSAAIAGVLGTEKPAVKLSKVYEDYLELTPDLRVGMSDDQIRKWKNPKYKAINNFIAVVGDKDVREIGREDGLRLRQWWMDRILDEGIKPGTANKDFTHLSKVFSTWCDLKQEKLENPFVRLRLAEDGIQDERPPFSRDWIETKLLAPDAFGETNEEAVLIFKILINTGLRPSEVIGAKLEHFKITHNVPHISIEEYRAESFMRKLKTKWSAREVPLVGVSLEAARRLVALGGVQKYYLKSDQWSALINKELDVHGLRETEQHTAYSLRHSFEDSLLEAGVDHRLRVELMGHSYERPKYGEGGSLQLKREQIEKIAFY